MKESDAIELLRPAVPVSPTPLWADLGAGSGTFTRALAALLGPDAYLYAVDTDERALRGIHGWAEKANDAPTVRIIPGDFTRPLALPPLDGIVMANALHFVRDQAAALALAASYLREGGRLVVIEYQHRAPSRWVPHPVTAARFAELAADAGLTPPRVVARRPSAYGGEMYVAFAVRDSAGNALSGVAEM
jgi:SAM-dependent methyltransferase